MWNLSEFISKLHVQHSDMSAFYKHISTKDPYFFGKLSQNWWSVILIIYSYWGIEHECLSCQVRIIIFLLDNIILRWADVYKLSLEQGEA